MFHRLPRPFLIRLGARLGIFAVVLQLVLSFAHIHQLPPSAPELAAAVQGNPSEHGPAAAGDCAICATIAAFATLSLPETVGLAVNVGWVAFRPVMPALWSAPAAHYRLFHTRAPPSAHDQAIP
jgi:hypothetical protein